MDWDDARVLNGDLVQGLKTMDWAKRFSVFLVHEKPSRSVGRVRGLVRASFNLLFDDSANFFVDARGYWNISLDLWRVRDYWEINRREEIFTESSALLVVPREAFCLVPNKVVH